VRELSDYYLQNATVIRERMKSLGYTFVGGTNSPYIWIHTGTDSWKFFDRLLNEAGVVCTPGAGFGSCGEGYVRISAFNSHENVSAAMDRISAVLK
jgi:LL-diaminopimelate aminotransferase